MFKDVLKAMFLVLFYIAFILLLGSTLVVFCGMLWTVIDNIPNVVASEKLLAFIWICILNCWLYAKILNSFIKFHCKICYTFFPELKED